MWELAVKCFKNCVKRAVTDQLFTFEEFNTSIIEVEGILNSRPLAPISANPNDLLVFTPGHFIIGDGLTSFPQVNFSEIPNNRLSNWKRVQKTRQHLWSKWSKEYLNELNILHKWTTGQHGIKEGTIVILFYLFLKNKWALFWIP